MQLYKRVLSHVGELPALVPRADVVANAGTSAHFAGRFLLGWQAFWQRLLTLRPLVRAFVESHVGHRLGQLRDGYRWTLQDLPGDDDVATRREWFREHQQELDELRDTLRPWTGFKKARWLWPPLAAALITYLGGDNLWNSIFSADLSKLGFVAFVVTFPWVYISFFCTNAFGYKRALFSGDVPRVLHREAGPGQPSIYEAEARLWNAIARRRKLEPRVDCLAVAASFFIFTAFEIVVGLVYLGWGFALLGGVFFGGMGTMMLFTERKRPR